MRIAITSAALVLLLAGTTTAATNPPALVEINSADWGDTNSLMRIVELERNDRTSKLKLTYRRMGTSVGSSMFIMRGFYEIAKARGAEYFINLKEWDDPEGGRLYVGGFTNRKDADPGREFGAEFARTHDLAPAGNFMSVSQLKLLFEKKAEVNQGAAAAGRAQAERVRRIQQGDLSAATNEAGRFEALIYAVKTASGAGKTEEARRLARELEVLAPKYKDSLWYGNAVQNFNQVLGRIALAEGNTAEAKRRLLASADSEGSPTMNSFGPNMTLAKDLLEKGERDCVLQYFDRCARFWKSDKTSPAGGQLEQWKAQVEKGEVPNFGGHLWY